MNKDEMMERIQDEDFIIRVRPFADDDGEWSGEIDISIMAFPDNPMTDDDLDDVDLDGIVDIEVEEEVA